LSHYISLNIIRLTTKPTFEAPTVQLSFVQRGAGTSPSTCRTTAATKMKISYRIVIVVKTGATTKTMATRMPSADRTPHPRTSTALVRSALPTRSTWYQLKCGPKPSQTLQASSAQRQASCSVSLPSGGGGGGGGRGAKSCNISAVFLLDWLHSPPKQTNKQTTVFHVQGASRTLGI
jgi:hypothetical protein